MFLDRLAKILIVCCIIFVLLGIIYLAIAD